VRGFAILTCVEARLDPAKYGGALGDLSIQPEWLLVGWLTNRRSTSTGQSALNRLKPGEVTKASRCCGGGRTTRDSALDLGKNVAGSRPDRTRVIITRREV
jgi:hypothetical protein